MNKLNNGEIRNKKDQPLTKEDFDLFWQQMSKVAPHRVSRKFQKTPTTQDLVENLGEETKDGWKDWYHFKDVDTPLQGVLEPLTSEQESSNKKKTTRAFTNVSLLMKLYEDCNDKDTFKDFIQDFPTEELDEENREVFNLCIDILIENRIEKQFSKLLLHRIAHVMGINMSDVGTVKKVTSILRQKVKELAKINKFNNEKKFSQTTYQKDKQTYDEKYQKALKKFYFLAEGVQTLDGNPLSRFPDSLSNQDLPIRVLYKLQRMNVELSSSKQKMILLLKFIDHIMNSHILNPEERNHLEELKAQINESFLLSSKVIGNFTRELGGSYGMRHDEIRNQMNYFKDKG